MKKSQAKKSDFLRDWITHPGFAEYLGEQSSFKLEVLASLIGGGTKLSDIANRRRVTRQAAYWHARAARRAFGLDKG